MTEAVSQPRERRLVPRKQALFRLGIGRQKWHELVQANRIPISQIGGRVFIRSDLLEDLIEHPEKLNGHNVAPDGSVANKKC